MPFVRAVATVCLLAVCAAAATPPCPVPLEYKAISDIVTRPEPPLPAMGPAGSIITDPTFGSRILRVTDGATWPGKKNWSFTTSAGGFVNIWNCDSTLFWVNGPAGSVVFAFDPATMKISRLGDTSQPSGGLVLPQKGSFSYRRPNILYCDAGYTVREYDFKTGTSSVVFDGGKLKPELTKNTKQPYGYPPSVSDDDTKFLIAFGGFQDTHPYVAWFDRATGKSHILDLQGSKIDGRATRQTLGFGAHSAYMDRTGRFAIIGKGEGRRGEASEWLVWDVLANADGGDVADLAKRWSGHEVTGFGWHINQAGYYGGTPAFYDEAFWIIRPLELTKLDQMRDLIDPQDLPAPHGGGRIDGHLSWHNAQPDMLVPVIESIEHNASNPSPWRAWDNEIIGIRTDGVEKKVWRFAHHRSLWDGKNENFWDSPRGNVSKDGRWFVFTSNWGRSLGDDTDPGHKGPRRDVFVVDLVSAHPPDAAPAKESK